MTHNYVYQDASFYWGHNERPDRPRIDYSGWQKFAMFAVWLCLVIYFISLMPASSEIKRIPFDPVQAQEWRDARNQAINEGYDRLHDETLTPEIMAQLVHRILAAEDSLHRMCLTFSNLFGSTQFVHEFFIKNYEYDDRQLLVDRYRTELDRLLGRKPEPKTEIGFWEFMWGISTVLLLVYLCGLATILIKRLPPSRWRQLGLTTGDAISIFFYSLVPVIGAVKYREDNWIKELADESVEIFLSRYRKFRYPKLARIGAYVYAALVVTDSILIKAVFNTIFICYFVFGFADTSYGLLKSFNHWLYLRPKIPRAVMREIVDCNAKNAPPAVSFLNHLKVNQKTGDYNKKLNYSFRLNIFSCSHS